MERNNFIDEQSRNEFKELINYNMPFGKFKNNRLMDLPVEYLLWFKRKGFPQGKLGRFMQIVLEIKS